MKEAIAAFLAVVTSVTTFLGVVPEKITHDGSRTGERVGYSSYCHPEQGFVIYENEKMPFVTDEGKHVLWTQGDISCYKERKLQAKTNPTPTLKTSPQGQVQGVTSNNQNAQQPKHDGSRTGRIIDYHALCEGKVIKVYENELVPYKRITGETIYTTKGDIKCYEDQISQLKNATFGTQNIPYQPSTTSIPTITCLLPYGTYQIPQADCDNIKAILSSAGSTKRDFDEENKRILQESSQKLNEIVNRKYEPQYTTPTFPTPEPLKIEVPCTKHYQPYGIPPIVVCP